MSIDIVVGGMYGSEAKGHATQRLVERRVSEGAPVYNIRVGGPNAGHTGYDSQGNPWAFRQIPVGVVVDRPVNLMIAAGSEIDLPVLLDEIDRSAEAGLLEGKTLVVHEEATLISDDHKRTEAELVGRVGSTGKGIGAARADRIMRRAQRVVDSPEARQELVSRGVLLYRDWAPSRDYATIIEGTQGFALGIHAGYYPECTSSNCRSIDFLSMAGISPWDHEVITWVVGRVYPIRVAGKSGPMDNETSWDALDLPEERTTVTKKVRRVGLPDWDLMARAVLANGGPHHSVKAAISMVDQIRPEVKNVPWSKSDPRWEQAEGSLCEIEELIRADIGLVMSGPNTAAWRNY